MEIELEALEKYPGFSSIKKLVEENFQKEDNELSDLDLIRKWAKLIQVSDFINAPDTILSIRHAITLSFK